MASDDEKIKTNSAPENEAPPEKKSTSGAEASKADGGEFFHQINTDEVFGTHNEAEISCRLTPRL